MSDERCSVTFQSAVVTGLGSFVNVQIEKLILVLGHLHFIYLFFFVVCCSLIKKFSPLVTQQECSGHD